jgi:NAD(P)-dependent dehydrogenase (short-subunit alcohol dehydrogenase family)
MPYSVTKAAGIHLMKCLASTQGPKTRVNAILPGLLLTEWVCETSTRFTAALTYLGFEILPSED